MPDFPATSASVRFAFTKGTGGQFPSWGEFSRAEIADGRQCLSLKLDVDPGPTRDRWKAKILEVSFLYDGITPIEGEDFGYRFQASKKRIQGYPAPVLRFLLDRPTRPSRLCRVLAGSWFEFTTSSRRDSGNSPYYAEDHNGYSSALSAADVAAWIAFLERHRAFSGRTYAFADGLPASGFRFEATDFALPPPRKEPLNR